ncbi:MAG: peptidoglycan DD-metalloendopeptidase family protein [Gammaproteobacteria bacterium]|nr:peptidoglycan DD-metalloendopeptidase family protein [Gammaproteobacteria bacterium]
MGTKRHQTLAIQAIKSFWIIACLALISFFSTSFATQHQQDVENREVELESIRTQIKSVQTNITTAKNNIDEFLADIETNEKSISDISLNIEDLENLISGQVHKLQQLQKESAEQENILINERVLLADQVRTAYKTGRHDFLKMLLNQENPDMVGRMMAYHDYYNKARSERISEIQITLNNLMQIELAINDESRELERFRSEKVGDLEQLSAFMDERKSSITDLNQYISEQDRQLANLQRDEGELRDLIDNLKNRQDVVELYENLPPFSSLKGKLNWPVQGKLITHFGSQKREGKLTWNGVRISADTGNDVRAVSAGKVIFADWFRNLGLLMIIDHGNGFMSLYGHNERLLKKANDFVSKGEIIAKVGNTGGQIESALYFEIRQQGSPQNPGLWCKTFSN